MSARLHCIKVLYSYAVETVGGKDAGTSMATSLSSQSPLHKEHFA